ncbi:hypothetical protein [Enterobacter kobei]|uniref:hypothetical protein n=1 Tax=Enterobacter kobei TaxID=208224 RepID=UPI0023600E85|nr:hypothetical protein [Enterobacter kobei]
MFERKISALRQKYWEKHLPFLVSQDSRSGNPNNYYSSHFVDVNLNRYELIDFHEQVVTIARKDYDIGCYLDEHHISIAELDEMQAEIIHHCSFGSLHFDNILAFNFNRCTRFAYLKTFFSRVKGALISTFFTNEELKSRDQMTLLNLLVNEYIQQRPSRFNSGVKILEVIDMLYGKLWYKHIRNEEFRREVRLLLKSLVITNDLVFSDGRYYVQPQAMATLVEYEKNEYRIKLQDRMQRNLVRLMIVITASTVLITLALLDQIGVVDLHNILEQLRNLDPVSFLMKLV